MSWRIAESLKKLREQINTAYPNRDKSSDGSIGDTAHSNRKSDHNPNAAGVVTAIDIDEDLAPDIHSIEQVVSAIRRSRDPRVKYIIYEGRITAPGSDLQEWKAYTGPSPHDHHAHVSVSSSPNLYDDSRDWSLDLDNGTSIPEQSKPATSLLKFGMQGTEVKLLQIKLAKLGFMWESQIDGDFGNVTKKAVVGFQTKNGLGADGIAGPNTQKILSELTGE